MWKLNYNLLYKFTNNNNDKSMKKNNSQLPNRHSTKSSVKEPTEIELNEVLF